MYGIRGRSSVCLISRTLDQEVFGVKLYPTVLDKAAYLWYARSNYPCFYNGNKRTALVTTFIYLRGNGYYRFPITKTNMPVFLQDESVLGGAKWIITPKKSSCVIIKGNRIVLSIKGDGIAPLLKIYLNRPLLLKDAIIVDKVIGKAAAVILVLRKTRIVYGEVMSQAAIDYLKEYNIYFDFNK